MELSDEKYAGKKEYMARTPSWLIRWGTVVLTLMVVVLFMLTYFLSFPNLLNADIDIKANIEPSLVSTNREAYLDSILIINSQDVKEGEVLGLLKNEAEYQDILKLKNLLSKKNEFDKFPMNELKLGKISGLYDEYLRVYKNRNENRNSYDTIRDNLKKGIESWENQNLLFASSSGKVLFDKERDKRIWLNKDENVFTIYPNSKLGYHGKMKIQPEHIREIELGQKVVITIDGFSIENYGALVSKISFISEVIQNKGKPFYYVGVQLDSLKTTTNKIIPYYKQMKGNAKITIGEQSMFDRLLFNSSR